MNYSDINPNEQTFLIEVKGLVQGVGFRPFIYKLATNQNLKGWVENRNDGVAIKITCLPPTLEEFILLVSQNAPPASSISSINYSVVENEVFSDFKIITSKSFSNQVTSVSPDIAVCADCLADIKTQPNRINYPFVNCTNCGPRFTIIKALPYDRDKTTMQPFDMCPSCRKEYEDVLDRRFHAQPVACSVCGPEYTLHLNNTEIKEIDNIIVNLAELLANKKIVAIKGLGGFFLACNAQCEETVSRLRKLKNREGKPFAVMFSDIETLKEYADVNEIEKKTLTSAQSPIVLLKSKKDLAFSVCLGLNSIGAMLPYMPLHFLLFEKLNLPAIVLTSGNLSDDPIIIENIIAIEQFTGKADAVLTYNRDIHNRADDSVVTIVNSNERILRRSRGYAPMPILLKTRAEGILATGAELVNCFCLGKGNQAIMSQHIGDLKNFATFEFYSESIERFKNLFRFEPTTVVSDMHPGYLSTQFAESTKLPHLKVQHHHAHIASCMAEHGIDEPVIGVSMDGTGFGDDNNIWGSEFFVCDLKGYKRITHFDYIPMPGGDKATEEPWRLGVAMLKRVYGNNLLQLNLPFLKSINPQSLEIIIGAIDKNINCPLSSGAGRLFDAVAAITGINSVSKFHAEAPMRLESAIRNGINSSYAFDYGNTISFDTTINQIVEDVLKGVSVNDISTKFHNTIIDVIVKCTGAIREQYSLNKVVLSGGTFQNRYILAQTEIRLKNLRFEVYSHQKVPTNDGGIALGQLIIAAKQIEG